MVSWLLNHLLVCTECGTYYKLNVHITVLSNITAKFSHSTFQAYDIIQKISLCTKFWQGKLSGELHGIHQYITQVKILWIVAFHQCLHITFTEQCTKGTSSQFTI